MNGSTNNSNMDCDLDFASSVAMATINAIFSFMGITGNFLVFFAVYKIKDLRTLGNAYLVILAIADFLTSTIVQPLLIVMIIQEARQECDETLTIVFRVFGSLTCAVSIFILCSITTERFLAVVKPIVSRNCHPKRRFSILISVSMIITLIYTILRVTGNKKATSYLSAILFVIVYIFIVSCYLAILSQLRRHNNKMAESTPPSGKTTKRKEPGYEVATRLRNEKVEKAVSTTMAIVIGIFTVMWVPFFYFRIAEPTNNSGVGYNLVCTIAFSNSALNPIVYALKMKSFRKAFKHIVDGVLHSVFRSTSKPATQSKS